MELCYVGTGNSGERAQPLFHVSKILEGEGKMNPEDTFDSNHRLEGREVSTVLLGSCVGGPWRCGLL